MGVAVAIPPDELVVEPGADRAAEVKVRNTGDVVDRFSLDILGDAAGWASVEPQTINLLPGEESTARITFAPPRTPKVTAGSVPFALRVMSHEDTEGSVISESSVTVEPFAMIVAELLPRTSTGSRAGRHELAVDNLGNQIAEVLILPVDPDNLLTFRLSPRALAAPPGTATFVKLRAIPRQRFWKGQNKTVPFEVTVAAPGTDPVTLAGALLQKPMLPPWLWKLLLVLVAAVIALAVLWMTVLKPEVNSTAREVTLKEIAPVKKAVAATAMTADAAAERAEEAAVAAGLDPEPVPKTGVGPSGTLPVEGTESSDGGTVTTSDTPGAPGAEGTPGASGTGGPGTGTPGISGIPGTGAPGGAGTAGGAPAPALTASATDFRITADPPVAPAGDTFTPFTYTPPKDQIVWISDVVLQNPGGNAGLLQIKRGTTVLLEFGLENFRDLDYHFIQPVRFSNAEPVVVAVQCRNPGNDPCAPSVYFTGQATPVPQN